MRYFLFAIAMVAALACNRSGKKASAYHLNDVDRNMPMTEVLNKTGEPTRREDMGTVTDEKGDTTHIVIWRYGNNESVTFINGRVNDVDTDNEGTRKRLQEIMDSAKAASPGR